MSSGKGQIKLGFSMRSYGYHASAWQHPSARRHAGLDLDFFVWIAQTAERGLLDMIFLADHVMMPRYGQWGRGSLSVRFEPLTLLSALSMVTKNVGLVATTSTSFQEPYHIARLYASLDHISKGRAAWNVITSASDVEARNFSLPAMPDKDFRYERARESVQAVTDLWASWEDDALLQDRESGFYFDPAKVRPINHKGKHFQIAGPLNLPRTPQGRPLLVQAGASDMGQELAAETADIVYGVNSELPKAQAFYKSLKGRLEKYGRQSDDVKIMPGLMPIIGATQAEAEAKYKAMQEAIDPVVGLAMLTGLFGDVSGYDLDGPVPKITSDNLEQTSRVDIIVQLAKEKNLSLRQLYQQTLIANSHNVVVGTVEKVADVMEEWFFDGGADGFNILPAFTTVTLPEFVDNVVPELQRRGLFRTRYEGTTLRENMGLGAPRKLERTAEPLVEASWTT